MLTSHWSTHQVAKPRISEDHKDVHTVTRFIGGHLSTICPMNWHKDSSEIIYITWIKQAMKNMHCRIILFENVKHRNILHMYIDMAICKFVCISKYVLTYMSKSLEECPWRLGQVNCGKQVREPYSSFRYPSLLPESFSSWWRSTFVTLKEKHTYFKFGIRKFKK